MATVLSIIAALLLLCILILVHELGHFGVGKLLHFEILEFSIGMGPKILKKEKNGILYSLRAFPIGGMCQFYGEDEEIRDGLSFNAQKVWKRFLVIVAGPAMNILFALLLAVITLVSFGDYVPQVHQAPLQGTPAYAAGIQQGDIIYAINGDKIDFYNQTVASIRAMKGDSAVVTVEREGRRVNLEVADFYNQEMGYNYLGVSIAAVRKKFGFFEAVGHSFAFIGSIIREMFVFLGSIFTAGIQSGDVVGPVGTISYIGQAIRMGLEMVFRMAILLCVNLGIMNLLPIPGLDGGRLVFLVIEGIRGKALPPEREGIVHFIGFALMMALVVVLTYQDIVMLIRG